MRPRVVYAPGVGLFSEYLHSKGLSGCYVAHPGADDLGFPPISVSDVERFYRILAGDEEPPSGYKVPKIKMAKLTDKQFWKLYCAWKTDSDGYRRDVSKYSGSETASVHSFKPVKGVFSGSTFRILTPGECEALRSPAYIWYDGAFFSRTFREVESATLHAAEAAGDLILGDTPVIPDSWYKMIEYGHLFQRGAGPVDLKPGVVVDLPRDVPGATALAIARQMEEGATEQDGKFVPVLHTAEDVYTASLLERAGLLAEGSRHNIFASFFLEGEDIRDHRRGGSMAKVVVPVVVVVLISALLYVLLKTKLGAAALDKIYDKIPDEWKWLADPIVSKGTFRYLEAEVPTDHGFIEYKNLTGWIAEPSSFEIFARSYPVDSALVKVRAERGIVFGTEFGNLYVIFARVERDRVIFTGRFADGSVADVVAHR